MDNPKSSRSLVAAYDRIMDMLAAIAAVLLVTVMLAVSVSVVGRYFFNNPMAWVIELSEYALLYTTFLGSPWLLRKGGHVKVDILLTAFGPQQRRILNAWTSCAGALTCLALAYYSTLVTLSSYQANIKLIKILEIPKFVMLVVIPVGCIFLCIEFVRLLRRSYLEGRANNLRLVRREKEQSIEVYL